jgi:hypothetical protein
MGTHDFRADISNDIRKFIQLNKGGVPQVLKVTREDAMIWHAEEATRESTQDFLENRVRRYLATLNCNGQKLLHCRLELLPTGSEGQTHFE